MNLQTCGRNDLLLLLMLLVLLYHLVSYMENMTILVLLPSLALQVFCPCLGLAYHAF